jgi:hypothetical protein
MLCVETPVPMADGTVKRLGDIVIGDVIIGSDGNPTTVLKAHPIQMPERAYEMKFASGDVIFAGGEHFWAIQTPWDRETGKGYRQVDTDTIYEMDKKVVKRGTITIQRVQRPEFNTEFELPVDPYILGLWLGNGTSHDPVITINKKDKDVLEYIEAWAESFGGHITMYNNRSSDNCWTFYIAGTPLTAYLRESGLMKDRKNEPSYNKNREKFIPDIYLRSKYASRLELLRGLMDSDGTFVGGSTVSFSQTDKPLLWDTVHLIRSLGGWVHPKIKPQQESAFAKYTRDFYIANFRIFDNPFKCKRKAVKWTAPKVETDRQSIVSIKPTEKRLMRCLTVDAEDHLFCVGEHYTVTANTATGVSALMTASQQRIELIARLMAETGVKQLFRKIISLNQQFVTEKIVIRLFNKQLEITPDKLDGSFDLMVNVGISAGMKELQQSQMLNLLNILPSLAELGLVQPLHIYNVVSKLLESMGYKDINNFIQNPEVAQQGNATPPTAPDGREGPAKMQPNAGNMFGQLQAEPMSASPKQTSPINTSTLFQV